MLFSMAKRSGSRRELKKIKKIKSKASKKRSYSRSDSYISDSYSDPPPLGTSSETKEDILTNVSI